MPYLIIIAILAAVGVIRLYVQHRRENVSAEAVDGFLDSLEAIAAPPARGRPVRPRSQQPARRRQGPSPVPRTSSLVLDPERREAARRRIEARRAGRNRLAG